MMPMRQIARARPLLGTIVAMRVAGLDEREALDAIERAFSEVATIHRCMTFHERDSDLSRLHRAAGEPVEVDERTYDVLKQALTISAESDGLFDPCVASELVAWNHLPEPECVLAADPRADWRDIELLDACRVRFKRALWIDLGGIAKGYAVDRALRILRDSGAHTGSVNAGGDLARFGVGTESVLIDPGVAGAEVAIDLDGRAVATSRGAGQSRGVHVHGRRRRAIGARSSVSVVADTCCIADALTKVMLADRRTGTCLLNRYRAHAFVFGPARGWQAYGTQ